MITTLSQLVAQVESNGRIEAIRFEPAYRYDRRALPLISKAQPGLSLLTYETILACSYGKFQVMADNLYMLGLTQPIQQFWSDEALQEVFFLRFVARRNIAYSLDEIVTDEIKRADFAHHYNGNTIGYSKRMMDVYAERKGE